MKITIASIAILFTLSLSCLVFGFGFKGTFFSIDPDVVYVANAISFIQTQQIHYTDHPGTPAIILISAALAPVRIYTKIILHINFVDWAFNHYDFLIFYVRIIFTGLFALSTYIFLYSINYKKFSWAKTILTLLILSSFSAFLRLSVSISPESILYLTTSIWIWIYESKIRLRNFLLGLIAGLAFATKFTGLFLVIASVLTGGVYSLIGTVVGFFAGIFPVLSKYNSLISWTLSLAKGTGVHGGGSQTIFDLGVYFESFKSLIYQEPGLIIMFILFLFKKRSKVGLVIIFGILLFAKFPLSYYQTSNFLLLAYIFMSTYPEYSKIVKSCILTIFLFLGILNISGYLLNIDKQVSGTSNLEMYIANHPAKIATYWAWGRTKDFSLLWARTWAGGLYKGHTEGAKLFDFDPNSNEDIFEKCWDKIYLLDQLISDFNNKYENKYRYFVTSIPDSGNMNLIESDHCI
jgi:hypothetical protein